LDHQHDAGAHRFVGAQNTMTELSPHTFVQAARTLILGLGETGDAAARWLARCRKPLRLVDTRANPAGVNVLREALGQDDVQWALGQTELSSQLLENIDAIVLSPGLSPHHPPVAAFLEAAGKMGIEVIGEIELFARAIQELKISQNYQPYILGVTGTNGKTTVTALTRHMLEAAGITARAAGNIGPSALTALMQALDEGALPRAWVLELSSFQLHTTKSLHFDASVVLNLTQDHLDWHLNMQDYAADKARIFEHSAIRIVNRDDPVVMVMVTSLTATTVRSFGRDAPLLAHDIGMIYESGMRWLVSAEPLDFEDLPNPNARRKKNAPEPMRQPGRMVQLMPADALKLVGLHNAMNVLAALQLGRSVGAGLAPMLRSATDYFGEPHRMSFVRTVREIDFYNDSKGTNVGATLAGIEGLDRRMILIAGGLAKGQDLSPLLPAIEKFVKTVVLIGQDAPLFKTLMANSHVVCEQADDMNQAVTKAFAAAQSGDAVVLSPACASLDMYKNYPHRGQVFIDAVNELALTHGDIT
jgi:UDP-N-acetylmuramoylalanine--D-glutamate ligase